MYTILVSGIEFYGYHGVSAEERAVGHRFRADLEVEVDGKADLTDELSDTVDYGALAALVGQASDARSLQTIERLAGSIADQILDDFKKAKEVRVKIAKLLPPVPQIVAEAAVEVRRAR